MKKKDILYIFISSFILTIAWIGFNIHHNMVTSTISDTLQLQIEPITAAFDTAIIDKLKKREKIEPLYEIKQPAPTESKSASSTAAMNGVNDRRVTTPIIMIKGQ